MPKISQLTQEAPGSTSDIPGNVGSTTVRFTAEQLLGIPVSAAGDMLYAGSATTVTRLAAPSSGALLYYSTADSAPAWVVASSGQFMIASSLGVPKWTTAIFINTSGEIGIGTTSPDHTLEIGGEIQQTHTATTLSDHAYQLELDGAGFGDVRALHINYNTGTISTGAEESVLLININESSAGGGVVAGLEVVATTGLATVYAVEAGAEVGPMHQRSGTFSTMNLAEEGTTDIKTAVESTVTNKQLFAADNATLTIGDAAKFEEIEFILQTDASPPGIKPTFEYVDATGFTTFSPTDGTDGLKNTGIISWDNDIISDWTADSSNHFKIRITRTANNLNTPPTELLVRIAAVQDYSWDSSGIVRISAVKLRERSAAAGDEAALGQLWVKTATPNELWFTDDAGTDFNLVGTTVVPSSETMLVWDTTANVWSAVTLDPNELLRVSTAGKLEVIAAPSSGAVLVYSTANTSGPQWLKPTSGGILTASSLGTPGWLALGSSGQYLQTTGGTPTWVSAPTSGHITTAGTSGQLLQTTGDAAKWVGLTANSLLVGNSSGEVTELAPTTGGVMIASSAGVPTWSTAIFVNTSQDVGIGTTTPNSKLSVNGLLALSGRTDLTIDTGAVTAVKSYHRIETEGSSATDQLDTINGGVSGDILVLASANSARDTSVANATGNIFLAGSNFVLSHTRDRLVLMHDGSAGWFELSRSDNL